MVVCRERSAKEEEDDKTGGVKQSRNETGFSFMERLSNMAAASKVPLGSSMNSACGFVEVDDAEEEDDDEDDLEY